MEALLDEELLAMEAFYGPVDHGPRGASWMVNGVRVTLERVPRVRVTLEGANAPLVAAVDALVTSGSEYLLAAVVRAIEESGDGELSSVGGGPVAPALATAPTYRRPLAGCTRRLASRTHFAAGGEGLMVPPLMAWEWLAMGDTWDDSLLQATPVGAACVSFPTTGRVYVYASERPALVLHTHLGPMQPRYAQKLVTHPDNVIVASFPEVGPPVAVPRTPWIEVRFSRPMPEPGLTATLFGGKIVFGLHWQRVGYTLLDVFEGNMDTNYHASAMQRVDHRKVGW